MNSFVMQVFLTTDRSNRQPRQIPSLSVKLHDFDWTLANLKSPVMNPQVELVKGAHPLCMAIPRTFDQALNMDQNKTGKSQKPLLGLIYWNNLKTICSSNGHVGLSGYHGNLNSVLINKSDFPHIFPRILTHAQW